METPRIFFLFLSRTFFISIFFFRSLAKSTHREESIPYYIHFIFANLVFQSVFLVENENEIKRYELSQPVKIAKKYTKSELFVSFSRQGESFFTGSNTGKRKLEM